jgi:hypothetical protein
MRHGAQGLRRKAKMSDFSFVFSLSREPYAFGHEKSYAARRSDRRQRRRSCHDGGSGGKIDLLA